MDTLKQDLRYAVRSLRRNPGFVVAVTAMLALGIALNTSIFSLVNAILFRPLPYLEPDRLIKLYGRNEALKWSYAGFSFADYNELRQASTVSDLAAYAERGFNLSMPSGVEQPERVSAAFVSANVFRTLGVRPQLGRDLSAEDDLRGAPAVALISHDLWQRRFQGRPDAIGATIRLDAMPHTVVGVLPPGSKFPETSDAWVSLSGFEGRDDRNARGLYLVGRLREGVSIAAAQDELAATSARLQQAFPESNRGWGIEVQSINQERDDGTRPLLMALLGAVAFVLLIACANVANLMLARVISRQREITLRMALGAGRARLVRQLLTESTLLALLGGAAGLLLSVWAIDLVRASIPRDLGVPFWIELRLDARVLAFTASAVLLTVFGFGLAPALHAARSDAGETLKEGGSRSVGTRKGRRVRATLVIAEVALAVVLLIGGGIMVGSFLRLQRLNTGFSDADRVLTMRLSLPASRYASDQKITGFYEALLDRVARIPGVESVGVFSSETRTDPTRPDAALALADRKVEGEAGFVFYTSVSPSYFETVGTPMRAGRRLAETDRAGAEAVAVVNEAFVRRYYEGQNVIGKQLRIGASAWRTIVGVAMDVREPRLTNRGVQVYAQPSVFLPSAQGVSRTMQLAVRAQSNPLGLTAAVQKEILAIDPDQPVSLIMTLERLFGVATAPFRWIAILFGAFGAFALLLAAAGIYAVIAYTTGQRTHEVGIRMSLGARPVDVYRLILGNGLRLTLAGLLMGVAAGLLLTRALRTMVYEAQTLDPLTFAGVATVLLITAVLASFLPARRAAAVDPMVALRHE